jgi:hypothetical protein
MAWQSSLEYILESVSVRLVPTVEVIYPRNCRRALGSTAKVIYPRNCRRALGSMAKVIFSRNCRRALDAEH